jgi:hypothetical protein
MKFKELEDRWYAESPEFWKKMQKAGIAIGGIGAVLATGAIGVITLPASLVTIGGYMVAVGSVTSLLSKLTKKDGQDNN